MDRASPFIIVRGDGRKDHELDMANHIDMLAYIGMTFQSIFHNNQRYCYCFDTLEKPSLKKTVALPEYLDIVITCLVFVCSTALKTSSVGKRNKRIKTDPVSSVEINETQKTKIDLVCDTKSDESCSTISGDDV